MFQNITSNERLDVQCGQIAANHCHGARDYDTSLYVNYADVSITSIIPRTRLFRAGSRSHNDSYQNVEDPRHNSCVHSFEPWSRRSSVHPCYTTAWRLGRLRRGPLGPYLGAHSEFLRSRGYTCGTIRGHLQTLQRFNTWLSHQGLLVRSLSEQVIEDFIRSQSKRYRTARNRALLRLLLEQLRAGEVVTTLPPEPPATPSDLVIREFIRHLQEERGFSPETIAY
jgi:hypothetical protein